MRDEHIAKKIELEKLIPIQMKASKKEKEDFQKKINLLIEPRTKELEKLDLEVQKLIQKDLKKPAVNIKSLAPFLQITDIATELTPYPCEELKEKIAQTIESHREAITKLAKQSLETALKGIEWPTPFTKMLIKSLGNANDASTMKEKQSNEPPLEVFKQAFDQLNKLQTALETRSMFDGTASLWSIDLLMQPLKVRFQFHFEGDRPTNSLARPEWMYAHVVGWINSHNEFLLSHLQPLLIQEHLPHDAKEEFIKAIIEMVKDKIRQDLSALLLKPDLLYLGITHALDFESTIRRTHQFELEVPITLRKTVTSVFTETKQSLECWVALERDDAATQFATLVKKEGAWKRQYPDMSDVDDTRHPKIAEQFANLLDSITGRYSTLPNLEHQVKFLDNIQLELISLFYDQIKSQVTEVTQWKNTYQPGDRFMTLLMNLNANKYIQQVMKNWGENLHFLELQFFMTTGGNSQDPKFVQVEGTVFDSKIEKFSILNKSILKHLLDNVLSDFKERTFIYFKKRLWKSEHLNEVSDLSSYTFDMSYDMAEGLSQMRDHLTLFQYNMNVEVFEEFWRDLARSLNTFIFESIMSQHDFTMGSAHQFNHDVKGLLLLFRPYTPSPASFFAEVVEICRVLMMSVDDLKRLTSGVAQESIAILRDLGIQRLSFQQLRVLLQHTHQKTDL
eukprot:TRINITY_DN6241_c0_g1_i1.p1 TRINITY_DN6241_c0_g1~~TRINITY_DN6241_c0_g1_i1.p1  ORF type:complete len:741 (+),score=176.32 TRINITY_DN6241_c0_g1_i1:195-2225(+)